MKHFVLFAVGCCLAGAPAAAQTCSRSAVDAVDSLLAGTTVRHLGPGTMSGRVTAIAVERHRPHILYVGTASGGLFRSTTAGTTWESLFDDGPTASIGAVALAPSNPDVLWIGTGEGNPRNSHSSGRGVFRSLDGGATWEGMGLEGTRTVHRIVVHPTDPKQVWVAATGSAWGDSEERGVYRTKDGGATWKKVLYVDARTGAAELIQDPSNPDKLFCAMWSHRREPWFFTSGGPGSGLYVTHDGGEHWQRLGEDEGLPAGELGRIGLAMSAADPDVVYALVESEENGLYRSKDGGASFDLVTTENIGSRPFYYAEIYADPHTPDRLFNLHSMVEISEDGGRTFTTLLPYSGVHPDHHAFYIHPDDPQFLIDGNDGGLNISRDGGETWTFVNNLPVGQFYHIAVDDAVPYRIYGGLQDNGSWVGPSEVWHEEGILNGDWQEILFGDGFDVVPAPGDLNTAYAMYQGGSLHRVDLRTGGAAAVAPVATDSVALRFNWNAAIATDPFHPDGLYFGSQFVHRSADRGESWQRISPDLTTNDPEKQRQAESGGLTLDATAAENHCTVLCIAPSPHAEKEIWAGTDDGRLQRTLDGGATWKDLAPGIKRFPANAWIPVIRISPHDPREIFVVVNNYRTNDWAPYLYVTNDGGATWKRRVDTTSGVTGHVWCVEQDPVEPNLLFLGTEEGLYLSFDRGASWRAWKHGIPAVPVSDLVVHRRDGELVVGTFGRGVYIVEDLAVLRAYARRGAALLADPLAAFPVRPVYDARFRRPPGARFEADPVFRGTNRAPGAAFPVYIHPDTAAAHPGKEALRIALVSTTGDTVRHAATAAEGGLTHLTWGLDTDGVAWPRRGLREARTFPSGGGPSALPGTYTARIQLGEHRAEFPVEVRPDPRVPFDAVAAGEAHAWERKVLGVVERAAAASDTLQRMRAVLEAVSAEWAHLPDTLTAEARTAGDSLKQAIEAVEKTLFAPKDLQGMDHVTERLGDGLWQALSLVGPERGVGANARTAYGRAERSVEALEAQVEAVAVGAWALWVEAVESVDRSPRQLITGKR
jgi:photosystem II stability/assembly factor-like uncharacterized protein